MTDTKSGKIAILGGGNIGVSIARGLAASERYEPGDIYVTRRNTAALSDLKDQGFLVQSDSLDAVKNSEILIIAVRPLQIPKLIDSIRHAINPEEHKILSVASGVSLSELRDLIQFNVPLVRVMPNTAIAVRESMTCLSADPDCSAALEQAQMIFNELGQCIVIEEEQFNPATALCACGTAFFLRAIRAASQGGIQIGFHSDEALVMAAQTARGAASLLIESETHPEEEIDKVTTPRGCTIAGLNQMEHEGFSSAMIRGIVKSSNIAGELYAKNKD